MRWKLLAVFMMISPLFLGAVAALDTTVRWDLLAEPTVITNPATNITDEIAILHGNLTDLGDASSANVSFQWGPSPTLGMETPSQEMDATGIFEAPIIGLEPDRSYYFRAKAVGNGTGYGSILTFTTEGSITPEQIMLFGGIAIWLAFIGIGLVGKNEWILTITGLWGVILGIFMIQQLAWWFGVMPMMVSVLFIYMGLFNPELGRIRA